MACPRWRVFICIYDGTFCSEWMETWEWMASNAETVAVAYVVMFFRRHGVGLSDASKLRQWLTENHKVDSGNAEMFFIGRFH